MRERKKTALVATVLAAALAVSLAGCGNNSLNAAERGSAGHEVSPVYGAAGGPRIIPSARQPSTGASSSSSSSSASASKVPTSQQLNVSLLGPEDSPDNAGAYPGTRLQGGPACVQPVTSAPGSTGTAAEVFFRSNAAAPGGNTYPGAAPGTPNNPLQVAEYLQSYPPSAVKGAYQKEVAALAACKQASFTINGARLTATSIARSSGPPLGSPTTGFVATVTYKNTPLHAAMVVGVVGDVLAMVATATSGPPDPATLNGYVSKAISDIKLHINS